ncbi:hypothetical protein MTX26_17995 [Bradyrhizobium sp. ISRA443]|uniref:hypothetical protein n=1 Tax=unclassified Bradyrhizobium TaxID=2631580 RepID=UPI00247A3FB4|nr:MULTISPECIES: hypothetical protein [unclassified Bradyrhizobium]WGR96381.1 hypothetical protein MTX23_18005 [Bradyrhizobium sp. ISRA436]WGS03266.1 hypothetical protein MTX18_17995 [Bradyrhizobium sp. ISRA437]WGS10150.1 hypothetical protein MTX26_17995 [Bradyrhizobium sp. ISRA443]
MNMFVSFAAVAAAPAVALTRLPMGRLRSITKLSWLRVEQIVDLLRTRYICEGWKMDEDGAARCPELLPSARLWACVQG